MLELDGLTHEYGDARALDSVSLTIPDGQFLVLCGANGSGKSTLVRHLNGLLEPDAGRVLVDGTETTEDPVAARTTVGMAFQEPRDQFVAATVGGDVRFGPENLGLDHTEIDRRAEEALAAVGLDGRKDDRIETLSGGERERLAVAGALAMEPSYLVLDEPFTGLDSPACDRLLDHLRDLHAAGTGLIVVTHDLRDLLADAERVVCLTDGDVVVDDDPAAAVDALPEYGVRVPETVTGTAD
ncbi:ABC transporter ATP-binding protein [Halolamina sp. CBA1230]|uniref:energy-coupling factor ABC transporter ATP-binding protein n=1 Tax=Halolamina sp. CBA1230 TaxID=1853690 RepID=UPI0009A14067|nr:ABC transporter ATP-binding protein [Halolamina sp. CBA1230]QKY20353.1 ABC transporter ATP-binding protein [Halolamina sp. CBA1230]